MTGTVEQKACACEGVDAVACVEDHEYVTQWRLSATYNVAPRDRDKDGALSVVRGALDAEDAFEAVLGKPPSPRQARQIAARCAEARQVRSVDLAVVHTPGRFPDSLHCSIVYPPHDPLRVQEADWPPAVSNGFDECFEQEGVLPHAS